MTLRKIIVYYTKSKKPFPITIEENEVIKYADAFTGGFVKMKWVWNNVTQSQKNTGTTTVMEIEYFGRVNHDYRCA